MRPVQQWGLAARLLLATVAVVLVGSVTAWVVAAAVGPAVFHDHMIQGRPADGSVVLHAEEAFGTASVLTLSGALLVALLASVAVSAFLTRRLTRSLAVVTSGARRVAAGDHSARVPHVGMGREFDELVEAFNAMAADLSEVEATRRRMLGDLAHEMRTPLAILDGYLEAISDGVRAADEETVVLLRDQVARLARLGEDITLVTTAEEGRLTMRRRAVRVADLVATARAEADQRYRERGVELLADVSPAAADALLIADRDRLGQVLSNLLDNALRHTPPGGRTDLLADAEDGHVTVRVCDDGEGIAPEHLPHLFERFYRADSARDRAHGGSGIGLAVVRAIVRAHGGDVSAASDGPGRGASFTVTLPLVSPRG